ncbi:MAG: invasion associated locus B family protein [Rhodobacteraceae bacterium]|nr:invasion associated locus B family protein [Paracoccaceae bacterium]
MKKMAKALALLPALLLASPALAQSGDAASGLSMGEPLGMGAEGGDGFGETYVDEVFTDWERTCMRTPDGDDPCQITQLLNDETGGPVAEIMLFPLPPGQQAAAGATFLAPLETLLTAQLTMRVDGGEVRRYPFSYCSAMGCIARIGFTDEEIQLFKRGSEAVWTLVPAAAPDQEVEATMSLMGFTAAYDSLEP